MTDPHEEDDIRAAPDEGGPPGIPGWMKVSAVIVAVLALVLVAIMLISGSEHGPSRHVGSQLTGQFELETSAGSLANGRDSPWGHG